MEIRFCAEQDRAQLSELWARVFGYSEARNDPARGIEHKLAWDHRILIARDGAQLLGSLMIGYDGHRGWLYRMSVAPEARRRGVGRALVEHAERELLALGCAKINLQLHAHNDAGASFWRALGYIEEPRISMGKVLVPG
jgi:ribosomal protein S18 acetylase RimI-like enzyme